MDPQQQIDNKTNAPRKMRFAPKAPPRRALKPEVKTEVKEDNDAIQAKDLLQRFSASTNAKPKFEKKVAPSQVAFGYGRASTSIKSYGVPKGANVGGRDQGGANASGKKVEKEYQEPWDYYSNYPITLPLRRPYSGNPELLDEEEFGENSETLNFNGDSSKSAADLGLMEENVEPRIYFLQLPSTVPMIKQSASSDSNEANAGSRRPCSTPAVRKACGLNELPEGFMGKMLVYKSGAVKMKLGDTLYDVTPGTSCKFAQDVAVINTEEKHCCLVGELNYRAHLIPDIDSVMDSIADL